MSDQIVYFGSKDYSKLIYNHNTTRLMDIFGVNLNELLDDDEWVDEIHKEYVKLKDIHEQSK